MKQASCPAFLKFSTNRFACVVFPHRSTPSNRMKAPLSVIFPSDWSCAPFTIRVVGAVDSVRRSESLEPVRRGRATHGATASEQIERVGQVAGKRQVLRRNSNSVAVMVARIFVVLPVYRCVPACVKKCSVVCLQKPKLLIDASSNVQNQWE